MPLTILLHAPQDACLDRRRGRPRLTPFVLHLQPGNTGLLKTTFSKAAPSRRSCRREILDHVIALNEQHLRRVIRDYVNYYHDDRIHDSLEKARCLLGQEQPAGGGQELTAATDKGGGREIRARPASATPT